MRCREQRMVVAVLNNIAENENRYALAINQAKRNSTRENASTINRECEFYLWFKIQIDRRDFDALCLVHGKVIFRAFILFIVFCHRIDRA